MQIIQTWDGTVQDRYSLETGQNKTDILTGWDSKGLMQIIQTRDGTVKDRYSHETGRYKTDILMDGTVRDKCRLYRHWTGQYKIDILTRRDCTRQIYSRDGTVRD